MLSNSIVKFIDFFTLDEATINQLYEFKLNLNNWYSPRDIYIMKSSGLGKKVFLNDATFYDYIKILANNKQIDFYPTFLKILDILNLTDLDNQLEKIFFDYNI
jgi:hypothetical protein